MNHKNKLFLVLTMPFLASVLCFIHNDTSVSAYTATLTTSNSISLDALPSHDGVAIDEESINVTTTCQAGYNLAIATSTSSDLYLNGDDSSTATFTAVDGTSTLNNSENKWGFTLTNNASASTVFSPLSTTTSVLKLASQTASQTDIDDTFSIYYGTKVASSVTPGSYQMANSGSIIYYLTMEPTCATVDITYDGNGADAGRTMSIVHNDVDDGDTIDLAASNFKRTGYGFAGWSLDQNAGTKLLDNDGSNNPIVYGPNETLTIPEGFGYNDTDYDGVVKLYAVWIPSQGNLQNWTGCANLDITTYNDTARTLDITKNSITALTDQRDNNTYAVARLADGNCWMIENLRLDNTNSDNSSGALAQGYNPSFVGLANSENPWPNTDTTSNSLYSSDGTTIVTVPSPYDYTRFPRYNNTNTYTTNTDMASSDTNTIAYSYGNYYTWSAAIADISYFPNTDQVATDTSICPKGWYLPYGSTESDTEYGGKTSGGYYYLNHIINNSDLVNATSSKRWRAFPNNFIYSGHIEASSITNRSTDGFYWTSTVANITSSNRMYLTSDAVRPGSLSRFKYQGGTIRCIADNNFTVVFNTNGSSETFASQRIQADTPTTLKSAENLASPTGASYTNANNVTINGNANKLWEFWGWNTNADGSGDWYKNKEEVTNLAPIGGTITLYAQWKQATLADMTASTQAGSEKVIDHNLMQDMTAKVCYNSTAHTIDTTSQANQPYNASTNPGGYHTATLLDYRGKTVTDNPSTTEQPEAYTVAKLADNNCWMTNDLRLGSTEKSITLTSEDTDTNKDFTLPVVETSATKTQWGTNNSTEGLNVAHAYKFNNSKNLYNWYTATAGTSYGVANATTSICPTNWNLLTKDLAIDFVNAMGETPNSTNTAILKDPPLSLTNGYYNSTNQTAYSNKSYWTADTFQNASGYYFGFFFGIATSSNIEYVRTGYGYQKMMGLGIRCLATHGRVSIHYDKNDSPEAPAYGGTTIQDHVLIDETKTQPGSSYTRAGYGFTGWNTSADGTGISIAGDAPISQLNLKPGDSITLYAQWASQYTITYVDNCKTWASSDTNCTDAKSATTSIQTINLDDSGNGSGTIASYTKFTLSGWKIAEWTTNANGTGTSISPGSTYTIQSGVTQGSEITLYAHWKTVYTLQYDGNGSDNDSTGMGTTNATTGIKTVAHTYISENDTFDLFASNFKKAGYGFVGWSTDSNAWSKLTDNDTTNDVKIYGPNETYISPAPNGNPITTMYAVWAPAETNGGNPVYLQDWTGCDALTATTYNSATGTLAVAKNSITALTDQRDGNIYAIAKLADNNCWMIENLRLNNTPELSTTNTNISATDTSLPLTNVYGSSTSNYLSASSSSWCYQSSEACDDQSLLNTANTTTTVTPSLTHAVSSSVSYASLSTTIYSYGNYYNWYSATAGYGKYARNTVTPTTGDICPAGWRLPYGGANTNGNNLGNTKGGVYYLAERMDASNSANYLSNSRKFRSFPINYIFSGSWSSSSASSRGSSGNYWTSSGTGNTGSTYYISINHYSGLPGNTGSNNRYLGYTVRCVTQDSSDPVSSVSYEPNATGVADTMDYQFINSIDKKITLWASNFQRPGYGFAGWNTKADGTGISYGPNETIDITAGQYKNDTLKLYAMWVQSAGSLQTWTGCSSLATGAVTALTDQRDNNTYAIAKLADGNCWMIENLRLDDTSTLSSTNTNSPASGFTKLPSPISPTTSPWCDDYTESCSNQLMFSNDNTANSTGIMKDVNANAYSYGNYYNWRTATASNGTYNTPSSNTSTSGDICPAGWRLPKGGNKANEANNELWSLVVNIINNGTKPANYNNATTPYYTGETEAGPVSYKLRKYPNNFIYSGYARDNSIKYRGVNSGYWTSTLSTSGGAYGYQVNTNAIAVYPGTASLSMFIGGSVRCIKK